MGVGRHTELRNPREMVPPKSESRGLPCLGVLNFLAIADMLQGERARKTQREKRATTGRRG